MKLSKIASFCFYIIFFIPYTGVAFPAYLVTILMIFFCLVNGNVTVKKKDVIILLILIMFICLKILQVGFVKTELFTRYYFGWILLYFFLYITKVQVSIRKILIFFCLAVIFEAILINTLIPTDYWPNYPDLNVASSHRTSFFGFYQRVYSVGTNASISGAILSMILLYIESLTKKGERIMVPALELLAFVTVVLFASGVAIIAYLIYLLYKFNIISLRKRTIILISISISIFIPISTYFNSFDSASPLSRISMRYFQYLFDFKMEQIRVTIEALSRSSYLIGYDYPDNEPFLLWNDFAIRDMIHTVGFLGFGILILNSILSMNKNNYIIILLGVLSALHYGSIFSISGQLIFAYALLLSRDMETGVCKKVFIGEIIGG